MRSNTRKIIIGREQREVVPNAELRENRIDGADLNPGSATTVAKLGCVNVVLAFRRDYRQGAEAIDDLGSVTRARETLEELLEHKAGRDDRFSALERALQRANLRQGLGRVSPEGERPHASIDKQGHLRDRRAL